MTVIQATCGWNFTTGSANTWIGVTDTGTNFTHPDLGNYAINPGESGGGKETNGLDDDSNGYIDDWRGYDLANNDNNAQYCAADPHGTHVTGLCAATTNNNTGVAGVGWNCKYLPVKIADDNQSCALTMAYEGIQYAALMGCK